jgi:hypothetical protein
MLNVLAFLLVTTINLTPTISSFLTPITTIADNKALNYAVESRIYPEEPRQQQQQQQQQRWWSAKRGDETKDNIHLRVDTKTGEYAVSLSNKTWLVGSSYWITVNGSKLSNVDGSLVLQNTSSFDDSIHLTWHSKTSPNVLLWSTSFIISTEDNISTSTILFEQIFHTEIKGACRRVQSKNNCTWSSPSSGFPTFDLVKGRLNITNNLPPLGVLTFHNQGASLTGTDAAAVFDSVNNVGFVGGQPLAFVDRETMTTLVISPVHNFLSTAVNVVDNSTTLAIGVQGAALTIPSAHKVTVVMHAGNGISNTFLSWGDILLERSNKTRTSTDVNAMIETLGYSTVGHYFYGLKLNSNAEETLLSVKAANEKKTGSVPFGWFLIDSWWYGEAATPFPFTNVSNTKFKPGYGGTWRWDDTIAREYGFPSGLKSLHEKLGVPFVAHMGKWIGNGQHIPPPYSNPTLYPKYAPEWVVEKDGSLPLNVKVVNKNTGNEKSIFWEDLFFNASKWGLLAFKLDHTQQQIPTMIATQSDVNAAGSYWLKTMTNAAAKHGIGKMYGGAVSSMFLHSTTLPSAFTARVGNDYIPEVEVQGRTLKNACTPGASNHIIPFGAARSASISRNSIVPWSLGLRPYKDAFFSGQQEWSETTCFLEKGSVAAKPEWYGLQDPFFELSALVSALAAGPIAVCDGIGQTNSTTVNRVSRADGVLLKPDMPAILMDRVWIGDMVHTTVDGSGQSMREMSTTHTSFLVSMVQKNGHIIYETETWFFVLGWWSNPGNNTLDTFDVVPRDLLSGGGDDMVVRPGYAWQVHWNYQEVWWSGYPPQLVLFNWTGNETLPIIERNGYGNYTFWRTAPIWCEDGTGTEISFLGERGKFISMSAQRVTLITVSCYSRGFQDPMLTVEFIGMKGEHVDLMYEFGGDIDTATCVVMDDGKKGKMMVFVVGGSANWTCE